MPNGQNKSSATKRIPATNKSNRRNNSNKTPTKCSANTKSRNSNRLRSNPTTLSELRTPGTIIQRLAQHMSHGLSIQRSPYVECRLGCISNIRDPPTIPDGNSGRCLASCSYSSDRISISSGTGSHTFRLVFAPFYPFAAFVINPGPTHSLNVNGVNLGPSNSGWLPIALDPAISSLPVGSTLPGAAVVDPYNASNMRIVSRTAKITYTGPVTTCSGVLRIYENAMSVALGIETTNSSSTSTAPTSGTFLSTISTTNNVKYAPINTNVDFLDFNDTSITPMNTMTVRPEQGATLMMRHKTSKFAHVPLSNMMRGLSRANQAQTGSALPITNTFLDYSTPSTAYGSGYAAFDGDWISQVVQFDNINQDASFLIETMCCYEWTVQANSAFRQFEKEPTPAQLNHIKQVDAALSEGFVRPNAM